MAKLDKSVWSEVIRIVITSVISILSTIGIIS